VIYIHPFTLRRRGLWYPRASTTRVWVRFRRVHRGLGVAPEPRGAPRVHRVCSVRNPTSDREELAQETALALGLRVSRERTLGGNTARTTRGKPSRQGESGGTWTPAAEIRPVFGGHHPERRMLQRPMGRKIVQRGDRMTSNGARGHRPMGRPFLFREGGYPVRRCVTACGSSNEAMGHRSM